MKEVEQLDTLFPQPTKISLASVRGADGETVEIDVRPIRVGKLSAFMKAVNGLLPAFNDLDNVDVTALVIGHTDQVIDALAVALDVEHELIEQLDLADLITAVTAVIEVNADFFTHRLRPALEASIAAIARLRGPS